MTAVQYNPSTRAQTKELTRDDRFDSSARYDKGFTYVSSATAKKFAIRSALKKISTYWIIVAISFTILAAFGGDLSGVIEVATYGVVLSLVSIPLYMGIYIGKYNAHYNLG